MQVKIVTGTQIRAARSALSWSVKDLSAATGVGTATLVRYEATMGVPTSRKGNIQKVISALEQAGIEFIGTPEDGPGIRIRPPKPGAAP